MFRNLNIIVGNYTFMRVNGNEEEICINLIFDHFKIL
jgi:hypothetical protein